MQTNTVQTLIDYVKDITGQTEASDAKIVRALNFATDHYSYLKITAGGRWKWDSPNQSGQSRATATLSGGTLSFSDFSADVEAGILAIQHVEAQEGGKYYTVKPIDQKDSGEPLDTVYDTAGVPLYYDIEGRTLNFYPSTNTGRTVRLTFSRVHPRYSTDSLDADTGVDPVHDEYIALYAADRIMLGTNDPNRNNIKNELLLFEREIRDLSDKQDQDTPRLLRPKIAGVFKRK